LAGRAFRQRLTLAAEATVAEAMAVATWAAAILAAVTAEAATVSQDAAVIGADTAVTDMAVATDMDMADAIHTMDVDMDTAPAALLAA
jgi:hypothetical protein